MTRTIRANELRKGDTIVKNDGRTFTVGMVSSATDMPYWTTVALIPSDGGMIQRVGLVPDAKVQIA